MNSVDITEDLTGNHLESILKAMRSHLILLGKGMTCYFKSNMEEEVGGTGDKMQGTTLEAIVVHGRDAED